MNARWSIVLVLLAGCASKFPALLQELALRGWSDAELRMLAGENLLRVLRAAEKARAT